MWYLRVSAVLPNMRLQLGTELVICVFFSFLTPRSVQRGAHDTEALSDVVTGLLSAVTPDLHIQVSAGGI